MPAMAPAESEEEEEEEDDEVAEGASWPPSRW
jgi:hypothetical protein